MGIEKPALRVALADNTVGAAEIAAVNEVLTSGWLSAGPVTRTFEEEFAEAMGVTDAVAVSSGTAALHLAMLALNLGPGDEVIVPSLSFVASAAMVALCGGTPVFADVLSAEEPTIAPAEVRRLLGPRTRAVVVMHYGGYPARTAEIADLARAHGAAVVEDAAHAPLVRSPEGTLGTIGDFGCFSFHATKNLTTGEGGMVLARRPEQLDLIRLKHSHHVTRTTWERAHTGGSDYDVNGIGLNYRPTEISSAIGRTQLARLAEDRAVRRRLVHRYRDLLRSVPEIGIPFARHVADSAFHLMAILLPAGLPRDAVVSRLRDEGVQTSVHYRPTHLFSAYREGPDPAERRLPVTERMAGRLLTLPLHARMTEDDVTHVVTVLTAAVRPAGRAETT
ncbi:dTDP-4-amino-4,6-dideoxygalactose transaminase [Sinosporangium album]|uniref:dTDP-4-amino-4,6-dideoxygalactose transaminase n=1 Tax=Sinosporangium album TaxID=504805 RepID=A0A1G8A6U6_9ACTN|nr:DegT/DnrJ/EryC1/StrS family aminotransferase [Sinosporangium album]SDH16601.1 dTDP-4-amino-4,6-dideoxygalactose transaminase [Sinosporangium album]